MSIRAKIVFKNNITEWIKTVDRDELFNLWWGWELEQWEATEALKCISIDNRCRQLVLRYDSARIKRVSVNVLACLNMFIAVGVRVSGSGFWWEKKVCRVYYYLEANNFIEHDESSSLSADLEKWPVYVFRHVCNRACIMIRLQVNLAARR